MALSVETVELDVTNNASVDTAFKVVSAKTGGKLDVLVNNAGLASAGIGETFTPEQLRDMFEVNVIGVQRMLRAALPDMRKNRSGLVINIGSIVGRLTIPFFALYGASKHAVEALTEGYRYEVSQFGVDVVLVQPGPFATNLYSALQVPADAGRAASYGEVANLPSKINTVLGGYFAQPETPQPHAVAEIIAKLIDTPAGKRPERIVAGSAFGADIANEALKPLQAQMVAGFGLTELGTLKAS